VRIFGIWRLEPGGLFEDSAEFDVWQWAFQQLLSWRGDAKKASLWRQGIKPTALRRYPRNHLRDRTDRNSAASDPHRRCASSVGAGLLTLQPSFLLPPFGHALMMVRAAF
jgi:hypothetical protein